MNPSSTYDYPIYLKIFHFFFWNIQAIFLDFGTPKYYSGFIGHTIWPENCLKSGWTRSYGYDIMLLLTSIPKDYVMRISMFYDRLIRFLHNAMRFQVESVRLDFSGIRFHCIPGLSSPRLEDLDKTKEKILPHFLVGGLLAVCLTFFLHSNKFSFSSLLQAETVEVSRFSNFYWIIIKPNGLYHT